MTNKSYAITMSLIRSCLLAGQIAVSPSAAAQSTPAAASQQPALMDREREIALALSAAVRGEQGGGLCLGKVGLRQSPRQRERLLGPCPVPAQEPRCKDAEGTRTHLPRVLKAAELRSRNDTRTGSWSGFRKA